MRGLWLSRIARRLTQPDTFDRLVSPAIADLQSESARGWMWAIRHYPGILAVLILALLRDGYLRKRLTSGVFARGLWKIAATWHLGLSLMIARLIPEGDRMTSMRKVVVFGAGLLAGAGLMFVSQNMMAIEAGSTSETFSAFLQRLDNFDRNNNGVKEVTYTGGTGIEYVTGDGKKFVTTAPPAPFAYDGLTNRIVERGIVVKAKQRR